MNEFHQLVSDLYIDTKGAGAGLFSISPDSSLAAFMPELVLCATIVLMLLVKVFRLDRHVVTVSIALAGVAVALLTCLWHTPLSTTLPDFLDPAAVSRMEIFTGMLVYDTFTVFLRAVLLLFAFLLVIMTLLSGIPNRDDAADVYTLMLGATLGMCLMASANHLLTVFLAVEMASVPSYALAGMLRGNRRSSEAALKYAIYGAGAAGVMLYGISLLAGIVGSAHLPTMAAELAVKLAAGMPPQDLMVLTLGGLMVMVGLAFKLSAVPFHFWCPDVFEGAAAEVNAFLSVASKAAALALLVRVAIGLGFVGPGSMGIDDVPAGVALKGFTPPADQRYFEPGFRSAIATSPASDEKLSAAGGGDSPLMSVADKIEPSDKLPVPESAATPLTRKESNAALAPVRDFLGKLIAFLAVITCTFGNLAAYAQTNIKRLMAYSTIAHAGYMMMSVPAVLALAGHSPAAAQSAVAALCIYIGVYLFMNLGAFAIIAFLRNAMGSEEIADYGGLLRRCPGMAICLSIILFSLVGLPPLAGFIGKFAVFAALVDGYQVTSAAGTPATYLMVVLVVGGINTAISLFYYLRVVKVMTMDPEPQDRTPYTFSQVSFQGAYVCIATALTVWLFFFWGPLKNVAEVAARHLLS